MFIEPIILSFIVAKLRKGKIKHIEQINIKGWYLFIIAALIQLSISFIKGVNIESLLVIFNKYFIFLHAFTYLLLIIGLILNIRANSMKMLFVGIMLNLLVILFNGGQMPVSLGGIKGINDYIELPERQFDIKHSPITEDTKLVYLADIILIPRPYPLPKIVSIGDIFIMIGVFLFFQEAMVNKIYCPRKIY